MKYVGDALDRAVKIWHWSGLHCKATSPTQKIEEGDPECGLLSRYYLASSHEERDADYPTGYPHISAATQYLQFGPLPTTATGYIQCVVAGDASGPTLFYPPLIMYCTLFRPQSEIQALRQGFGLRATSTRAVGSPGDESARGRWHNMHPFGWPFQLIDVQDYNSSIRMLLNHLDSSFGDGTVHFEAKAPRRTFGDRIPISGGPKAQRLTSPSPDEACTLAFYVGPHMCFAFRPIQGPQPDAMRLMPQTGRSLYMTDPGQPFEAWVGSFTGNVVSFPTPMLRVASFGVVELASPLESVGVLL